MTDGAVGPRGALKEISFIPVLFGAIFGAPSIVSLIQAAFVTGDLAAPLQSIIDAYQHGMQVFGDIVEPYLQPVLHWIGGLFKWDLHLFPHWRHLLVLSSVFWLAWARVMVRINPGAQLGLVGMIAWLCTFVGCVIAGLQELDAAHPFAQVVIAALPPSAGYFGIVAPGILLNLVRGMLGSAGRLLVAIAIVQVFIFGIAFALVIAVFPIVSSGAGVAALGAFVIGFGLVSLANGLLHKDELALRMGLIVLGGFIGAGLVYALDWVIKSTV